MVKGRGREGWKIEAGRVRWVEDWRSEGGEGGWQIKG